MKLSIKATNKKVSVRYGAMSATYIRFEKGKATNGEGSGIPHLPHWRCVECYGDHFTLQVAQGLAVLVDAITRECLLDTPKQDILLNAFDLLNEACKQPYVPKDGV